MHPVTRSFGRLLKQPAFVAAALLLGVAAVGLNAATAFLQLHFKKLPVPLAVKSLREGLPAKLGTWEMVSKDTSIDSETEQVLGTSEYVFRDYVDTRTVPADIVQKLKNASPADRDAMLTQVQQERPASVLRIGVTYYTGMADTVAHVPERCYVADGFDVVHADTKSMSLGNYPDGRPRDVNIQYLTFEDTTGRERIGRNVAYLFHCNGKYLSSPYEVRGALQNLFQRYGYYAKIELMTTTPQIGYRSGFEVNKVGDALDAMADFLASALPEFEKCMPDWSRLEGGQAKTSAPK
jgi:hypothetical protein